MNLSSSADSAETRHDEIARLEDQIEELAVRIERCLRIIFAAKIAIAVGGVLLLALMVGLLRFDATAMIVAISAVIGGIVAVGSNTTTANQARAEMETAEARRAALIAGMDLRVVG